MFLCKNKRILTVMLILCFIWTILPINASSAKKMYVKKAVTVKTKSGDKIVAPKFATAKVKYKTKYHVENLVKETCGFEEDEIVHVEEMETPLSALPTVNMEVTIKIDNIKIDGKIVNIDEKYLTEEKPKFVTKNVPYNRIKSYMSYRAITASGSPQYKLQHSKAYTDPFTGVRMVGGRYCVAMGASAATKIGTKIDLIYENGKIVHAILGDQKAGASGGWVHPDGSAVEFLVDMGALPSFARLMGDMSVLKKFKGRITQIKVFKEN